jgi:hypothetical protein
MANSKSIAGLVGPSLMALSASEAANVHVWPSDTPAGVYFNGAVLFVAGLAIVREPHFLGARLDIHGLEHPDDRAVPHVRPGFSSQGSTTPRRTLGAGPSSYGRGLLDLPCVSPLMQTRWGMSPNNNYRTPPYRANGSASHIFSYSPKQRSRIVFLGTP